MKLEWYRQHKKFVYWVLLPVVGGGMAFFGLGGALRSGVFAQRAGPSISYTVAGHQYVMDPAEVQSRRLMLARFYPHMRNASSDDVAVHMIKYQSALAGGFEAGIEEMRDRLREMVKWQVREREGTTVEPTPEIYDKLIDQMQITRMQFEMLTREIVVGAEYQQFVTYSPVSDPELFIAYHRAKEVVRLRYKEIKSEDFMTKAPAPTEEQITRFYDDNKGKPEALAFYKDLLLNPPKMSADVLYYDAAKLPELKPTDDELKAYYERLKPFHWKVTPKEGEAPPPNTPDTYKPFDTVKAEVLQKWADEQKKRRPREKMEALKAELAKAEKDYNAAQAAKPAAERKPFDLADWAKKNDLVHWSTPEQTEEQYSAGKKEVGATDAGWVYDLFFLTKPMDPRFTQGNPALIRQMNERNKRMLEEFGFPSPVDINAPEKGSVIARKKKYTPEELKPLAQAHDAIAIHLKIGGAIDLAKKEAEKLREQWMKDGLDRAAVEALDEISVDSNNPHALAMEFFDSPKAIGDVLNVAQGRAEVDRPGGKSEQARFYIGFAVERKLPTWTTFHHDLEWDRDRERKELAQSQRAFLEMALRRSIGYTKPVGVKDTPLFEQYRGGPVDDDY